MARVGTKKPWLELKARVWIWASDAIRPKIGKSFLGKLDRPEGNWILTWDKLDEEKLRSIEDIRLQEQEPLTS